MYKKKGIGTARQDCLAFARRRAKIPKRNASLRKSLRSIFRSGPTRAAGVYRSSAAINTEAERFSKEVAPLHISIRPYAGGGCISLKRRDGLLVLKYAIYS
nr:MAG TPA: hypothetical protein [Microviridae sp.]